MPKSRRGPYGYIGTEHLLLGLLRDPSDLLQRLQHVHIDTGHLLLALEVLFRLGVDLDELEHDVSQQLAGDSSDPARSLRQRVRSSSYSTPDLASAGLAVRLDSIDKRLTDIAARLRVVEHHLTDE